MTYWLLFFLSSATMTGAKASPIFRDFSFSSSSGGFAGAVGSPWGGAGRRVLASLGRHRRAGPVAKTRHFCRENAPAGACDAPLSGVELHKTNPSEPQRNPDAHPMPPKQAQTNPSCQGIGRSAAWPPGRRCGHPFESDETSPSEQTVGSTPLRPVRSSSARPRPGPGAACRPSPGPRARCGT